MNGRGHNDVRESVSFQTASGGRLKCVCVCVYVLTDSSIGSNTYFQSDAHQFLQRRGKILPVRLCASVKCWVFINVSRSNDSRGGMKTKWQMKKKKALASDRGFNQSTLFFWFVCQSKQIVKLQELPSNCIYKEVNLNFWGKVGGRLHGEKACGI